MLCLRNVNPEQIFNIVGNKYLLRAGSLLNSQDMPADGELYKEEKKAISWSRGFKTRNKISRLRISLNSL